MQISTHRLPSPFVGEVDPDFAATWTPGFGWVVCYRDEDPDEVGAEVFGFHPNDLDLAKADLVRLYPREA